MLEKTKSNATNIGKKFVRKICRPVLDDLGVIESIASNLVALEGNAECKYRRIVEEYEKAIKSYSAASTYTVIEELTKAIITNFIDELGYFFEKSTGGVKKELLAALYVIWVKHKEYITLEELFRIVRVADIIGFDEEGAIFYGTGCIWSFDSFSMVEEAAKEYFNYQCGAQTDITCDIWEREFNLLLMDANEESFKFLNYTINNWITNRWDKVIEASFITYFEDCISKNISCSPQNKRFPYDRAPNNNLFVYDGLTCTLRDTVGYISAISSTEFAENISKFFPRLMIDAYLIVFFNKLCLNGVDGSAESLEAVDEELIELMQTIADYREYYSVEFNLKPWWKFIICMIIGNFNGNVLTFAIEMLNKLFYVSLEDIKNYIYEQMSFLLEGEESCYNHENDLIHFIEAPKIARIARIEELLSNRLVFEIVSSEKYAIIEALS